MAIVNSRKKRIRNNYIKVYFSDSEIAKVKENLLKSNEKHLSDFSRNILLANDDYGKIDNRQLNESYIELIKEISYIGKNINQITRKINGTCDSGEIEGYILSLNAEKGELFKLIREFKPKIIKY